jgi:hypothetical protein
MVVGSSEVGSRQIGMKTTTVAVGASLRLIYFREDPNATYIPCGFCPSYRAIDPSFMALHMLQCHESELLNAPAVSHNSVSPWYDLEARAIFITELIEWRNLKAGWLAVGK